MRPSLGYWMPLRTRLAIVQADISGRLLLCRVWNIKLAIYSGAIRTQSNQEVYPYESQKVSLQKENIKDKVYEWTENETSARSKAFWCTAIRYPKHDNELVLCMRIQ